MQFLNIYPKSAFVRHCVLVEYSGCCNNQSVLINIKVVPSLVIKNERGAFSCMTHYPACSVGGKQQK